jgi:hypothetical protein
MNEPSTAIDAEPASFARWLLAVVTFPAGGLVATLGTVSIVLGRFDLTLWGWLWSIEALALGAALATVLSRARRIRTLRIASGVGLAVLVLVRIAFFGASDHVALVVLDRSGEVRSSARWLDRLFEERDASMVGSRLLVALDLVPAREFPSLPGLLASSYPAERSPDKRRLGCPI